MTSKELIVDRVERKEVSRVKHLDSDLSEVYPGGQPVCQHAMPGRMWTNMLVAYKQLQKRLAI